MSKYFVFRIQYGDKFNLLRNELLNNHLLRQGWGTYDMQINQDYEGFKAGWQTHWEKDLSDKVMKARYSNLRYMLEIEPGDYIVVPKVSVREEFVCKSFVIAKCKAKYRFSVLEEAKDFGHIIEVEDVFSCSYNKDINSQSIKSKFRAYQSPLNRVRNEEFKKAVDTLVCLHSEKPEEFEKESNDFITMVGNATVDNRKQYLNSVKMAMQKIDNKNFEYLINELFVKNGYDLVRGNFYDREGGDADLIYECFNKNSLMYNIYDICDDVTMPRIYVQAKNKKNTDCAAIVGVEQLLKIKEKVKAKNAILIVINLTDTFTEDAKIKASENGILLINGDTFASLLIRYGIEVNY